MMSEDYNIERSCTEQGGFSLKFIQFVVNKNFHFADVAFFVVGHFVLILNFCTRM